MKLKKLLACILAGSMTLSLAACSSGTTDSGVTTDTESQSESAEAETVTETADAEDADDEEEDDLSDIIPEETVTLDVYDQLANYSGEQIGWFAQVMLEKFNVKLNIIPETEGTYDTRMESGNLGDIVIWGNDGDDYMQAVEKGMLFDWEEDDILADYGSYILENMPKALEKNRELSGGTIYGFGHDVALSAEDVQSFFYTWDLRYDVYQEIGAPEITDWDSLVDVLEQMQAACPTDDNGNKTYAVSLFNDWDGDMVMFVKSTATAYYGLDEFGIGLYDSETGTYYPALEEDGPYLTALRFYNQLYQRGLVDPDSQTQGYDGMSEDYQNGTALMNVFNWMGSGLYNTDNHLSEGKAMYPVKPTEATPLTYGLNVYGSNRIWSIGANTEYPELCMAIINWLSTPEGRLTSEYGPEGTCWYIDENGYTCLTDLGLACKTDISTELTGDYSGSFDDGSFQMNNTTWSLDSTNPESTVGETFNYQFWNSYDTEAGSEIESSWREWAGADSADEYLRSGDYKVAPGTTYSAGTHSDELQVIWDQVTTCIKTYSWKAIYAESDEEYEAIVAEMIQQANDYGYDQCVEFQENEAKIRQEAEQAALSAN